MGMSATVSQAIQASNDYETYLGSRLDTEDDDTTSTSLRNEVNSFKVSDAIIDGIQRNPYAAWEWGMVNRVAEQYSKAAEIHRLAANAFEEIGDKPRAVICRLDRGLDLASGLKGDDKGKFEKVKGILVKAIDSTVGVDGRDVQLLQRVVAKEGEARIALSGLLWSGKEKATAEAQFGEACGEYSILALGSNSLNLAMYHVC